MPSHSYHIQSHTSTICQVILIGEPSVGKTSILSRFSDQVFSSNFISTVGIDFKVKKIKRDKRKVKLQVMNGNVAAFAGLYTVFICDCNKKKLYSNIVVYSIAKFLPLMERV